MNSAMGCCGLLPLLVAASLVTAVASAAAQNCEGTGYQHDVDINRMTGDWYVVEIVFHKPDVAEMSTQRLNKCPRVRLERHNGSRSWLNLRWTEDKGVVLYSFNITESNQPGRWHSVGRQQGSMTELPEYRQFEGTALLLKVVEDHAVVTFCPRSISTPPFTSVLARERPFPADELESINKMIGYRHLYMGIVKLTCQGGAAALATTALLVLLPPLLLRLLARPC